MNHIKTFNLALIALIALMALMPLMALYERLFRNSLSFTHGLSADITLKMEWFNL